MGHACVVTRKSLKGLLKRENMKGTTQHVVCDLMDLVVSN